MWRPPDCLREIRGPAGRLEALRDEPDGPVYVVGFAGTNEMVAGEAGLTVDAGPLPDGQYQGESLVLMTLP